MKNAGKILLAIACFCFPVLVTGCSHSHNYQSEYKYNSTHHWQVCEKENCDSTLNYGEHVDTNYNDVCDMCGYGQVAIVGNVGYANLQEAVNNAESGSTITLVENIDLPTAVEISKEITINLNNKNLSVSQDTAGDGVFHIISGGNLTINGNGIVDGCGNNKWNIVIYADGGNVTINGGTYTNTNLVVDAKDSDNNHYDVIYAKNGSTVVINGGTFEGKTPAWLLNEHDGTREETQIIVKGGSFKGFNPANCASEGANTNFVDSGYISTLHGEYYIVTAE